jgi:hypothetical protein
VSKLSSLAIFSLFHVRPQTVEIEVIYSARTSREFQERSDAVCYCHAGNGNGIKPDSFSQEETQKRIIKYEGHEGQCW